MRESVTPYRKPARTSARPPQTRARARDVFLRGVFQIRSSPSEAWQRRRVHVFATGSCVERERERASSKYCYSLQLPRPGYRERTTGNLEVKLKRKTKRENTGGCALRSRGETSIHPCCSSDSSRFGDIPCRLPGAPHSPCLWTSSGEEGRTREEAVQRERRTMEGMQAYGAGKAGGAFDPVTFFQQPQTILRIVSWVSEAEKLNFVGS